MQIKESLATAAVAGLMFFAAHVAAQVTPQNPSPAGAPQTTPPQPPPQAPGAGRGAQGRGGPATFPAQQRRPGDPAVIERGKGLYAATCSACHGVDARGGQLGGPNLLRSQ